MFVHVPSARATKDITIEQDLVEEVGRIHRYGSIPEQTLVGAIAPAPRDDRRMLMRVLKDRLSGAARFHETISYSFLADDLIETLGASSGSFVRVVNPVAEGFSRVRRSVLPSLLAILADNRRRFEHVKLYEIGKGYRPEHASERGEPREVHELALAWASPLLSKDARFDADGLHQLQGIVEDLVRAAGIAPVSWSPCEPGMAPRWAHPARCLTGVTGAGEKRDPAITLAALEPSIARRLGLAGELASDAACAEISIDALLASPKRASGYRPVAKFPGVKVDVALAVSSSTLHATLVQAIEKAGKGLVESIELFDVYTGPNLSAGKKSLAYHVGLQSQSRTLTDQDVAKFLERLQRELEPLGAELRRA